MGAGGGSAMGAEGMDGGVGVVRRGMGEGEGTAEGVSSI